jgi:DNA polymerase
MQFPDWDKLNFDFVKADKMLVSKGFNQENTASARSEINRQICFMDAVYREIYLCNKCDLCKQSCVHNHVTGVGNTNAQIMFVAEAPGEQEDYSGYPLVGQTGNVLTMALQDMGLSRNDVWLSNVVKCRPEGNRTPTKEEMLVCGEHLLNEVLYIKPKVIVTLGLPAYRFLNNDWDTKTKMGEKRGRWIERDGISIMPTYHPSYVIRQASSKEPNKAQEMLWSDIRKAVEIL